MKTNIKRVIKAYKEVLKGNEDFFQYYMKTDKAFKYVLISTNYSKALLSLNGNKVEQLCATYILSQNMSNYNLTRLVMVSGVMQVLKLKRKGLLQGLSEDLAISGIGCVVYSIEHQKKLQKI